MFLNLQKYANYNYLHAMYLPTPERQLKGQKHPDDSPNTKIRKITHLMQLVGFIVQVHTLNKHFFN